MISVERAKTEPQGSKAGAKVLPPSGIKSPVKSGRSTSRGARSVKEGDKTDGKEGAADSSTDKGKETDVERRRSRDRSHLSDRARRELDVLSFEKIKAERERMRLRNKEMYLRHEERRRHMNMERESYKQHMMQKNIESEAMKLEREKRRLRRMREELEHEKMETERLKLETERLQIQREQETYRREQERVLQERRPVKRTVDRNARDDEWGTSKRQVTERFQTDGRGPRYGGKAERFERSDERPAGRFEGRRDQREQRPGRHERFEEPRERVAVREPREREYTRAAREEHRPSYREDQRREPRREERVSVRDNTRVPTRHESSGEQNSWRGMEWASDTQDGKWVEPGW